MTEYDVAIVGAGPAGLAAATTLARSLRSVVVVDAGEPRNAPAAGAHNVLGHDGRPPRDVLDEGRREAAGYGAVILDGTVTDVRRTGQFELDLADGTGLSARRLLLATGLVDELPDVPGLRERWGRTVLHCPYCHGWEVRGRRIGVLGTGPAAIHQTLMFRQLSDDVTLFTHTMDDPDDEAWEQLAALGVQVVEGTAREVTSTANGLHVDLGTTAPTEVDALVVAPRFVARADLFEALGGTMTETPFGTSIPTDPDGRTPIDRVWSAGNAGNAMAMVSAASADGVAVGAQMNYDLILEDVRDAMAARKA